MRIDGERIWIIGASSGIGAALALALAERGATLALSARRVEALSDVARSVVAASSPTVLPCDVQEDGALQRAAEKLRGEWGAIDAMIYSAGVWTMTDVHDFKLAAIEEQVAVNYVGLIRAIAAVLPDMLARDKGEIVGIGSLSGYRGLPRAAAYGSSKVAVNALLQSLRLDLRETNLGVTAVNPGFVRTQLTAVNRFPMPFARCELKYRRRPEGSNAGPASSEPS